jgi:uncharacterized protein YndB with AHSA1/START domain
MPERKADAPPGAPPTHSVTVTRHFDFPADRVFGAWLDPASVGKWLFATETGQIVRALIDPRVGGKFSIVDRRKGEDVEHRGEYLQINRPHRLVFTFSVPKYSGLFTTVTIDILPQGAGCQLTLRHDGVLPEYLEGTKTGWAQIFDGLQKTLSIAGA